jgi:hypothetical protein
MANKVILVEDYPGNVQKFIVFAQNVITCWTGNSTFTTPPVTLASVTILINLLVTSAGIATNKTHPAVTDRNNKRAKVETALGLMLGYAQSILDSLSYEDGVAAAASSGFKSKKVSVRTKQAYAITRAENAGNADIDLKALGRHGTVMYFHQYMLAGTTTWVDVIPTLDTKASVTGLPIGTVVQFRFRTLVKGVYSDWSAPRSYTVS